MLKLAQQELEQTAFDKSPALIAYETDFSIIVNRLGNKNQLVESYEIFNVGM
jgi:hypothetical protein